jgi:hypothetical protein
MENAGLFGRAGRVLSGKRGFHTMPRIRLYISWRFVLTLESVLNFPLWYDREVKILAKKDFSRRR